LKLVTRATEKRTVTPTRRPNADLRTREHLTEAEVERLMGIARKNRWGHPQSHVPRSALSEVAKSAIG
ncbi:MAG: hypothetical protein WBE90_18760, partial [Xanthobacteraceae bacterium]